MTNPDHTHLSLIVDSSGSMATIAQSMNDAIKSLLEEQAKAPGKLTVDAIRFNTSVQHLTIAAPADQVEFPIIVPSGGTALNDAIASTIRQLGLSLAAQSEDERPGKVILAIVTDGQENSSREYSGATGTAKVKAMLDEQKEKYAWEVIFMGAEALGDVMGYAASYGVGRGETISFASAGVGATMDAASSYLLRSRAGEATEFTEEDRRAAAGESA